MHWENRYILTFPENLAFSDEELFQFCQANPEINVERDKNKRLVIMSPAGSLSDHYSHQISTELELWNRKERKGIVFGSSSGFILSDGSMRSPDASWVSSGKWNQLTIKQMQNFAPVCPEFVVEVKSPSDSLEQQKSKMLEWVANGIKLGWLVDVEDETVYIYNSQGLTTTVNSFDGSLTGEAVLPGFQFDLGLLQGKWK